MRSPSKRISPAPGRCSPDSVRSVVVLPAPLLPMRVDDLPGVDVEADALDRLDLAVGDVEVADLEQGRPSAPAGAPEVGLDDPGVALHLGRRALDQLAALHEHGHPVAQAEDEPHVVLDDDDRHALVADAADQVAWPRRSPAAFMPAVGSSSSSRPGSVARARAISSRRWSP